MLAAERSLGRAARAMPHNHPGHDVPFLATEFGDFESTGITGNWAQMWDRGSAPW